MANEQNLIYGDKLSQREARENGRKGGKKSGEVRRMKADFKAVLIDLLEKGNTMEELGMAAVENAKTDIAWWQAVRDTIGQKPVDKRETNVNVNSLDKEQRDAAVQAALLGMTE